MMNFPRLIMPTLLRRFKNKFLKIFLIKLTQSGFYFIGAPQKKNILV